ncbi:MAG: substrate-binding domain-containing protein [Chloroflexi bacterium]|nr:substrate-binding domain-containing protein [Chloroflexota bacterium]
MAELWRHALSRRQFLRVAGLTGSAALLVACAPTAAPPPTTAPKPAATTAPAAPAATVAATTAPAAAATQAPAKAGTKVTLEMWSHFAGKNLEILQQNITEYQKANQEIEFKVTAIGPGEILTKYMAAVAGGQPPDIYHSPAWTPPDLALGGVLAPLDDIVKLPNPQLKNYDGITIYEGKRYGVPVNGGLGAMAYNKDLLGAAGVAKVPETWDELVTASQKMTKGPEGQWGILLPNKPDGVTTQTIWSLFMSNGVEMLSKDGTQPAFNTPEAIEVYQWAADLIQKHKVQPVKSYGQLDTWNDYGTGKIGAVNLYPVWLANIQTFKFKTVTGQMPKKKGPGSQFAGNYFTLSATKAKEKGKAFADWCAWWHDPKRNATFCSMTGGMPVSQAVIDTDIYQKYLKDEPAAKAYVDSLTYARPFPGVMGMTGVNVILGEAWESTVLGKSTAKEALAAAEKRAADELKRAQKR